MGAAAIAATAALALPAAAAAKTVTYGGGIFPEGKIALDVKLNKKNKPAKVVALRAAGMTATCSVSQEEVTVWTNLRKLGIRVKNGGFKATIVDPDFGNRSKLTGEFKKRGKRIDGGFTYSGHFPAGGGLPEEDCNSETQLYTAAKGGEDVDPGPPNEMTQRR